MEPVVVWYLRMSVIYFVAGVAVGLGMLLWPGESGYYIPVHVHVNLLGFMSMMIYGVGYHILPKFSGRHIYSPLIMRVQFWMANAGLIGMVVSWPFHISSAIPIAEISLIFFAIISLIAILLFAFNILKTVKSI